MRIINANFFLIQPMSYMPDVVLRAILKTERPLRQKVDICAVLYSHSQHAQQFSTSILELIKSLLDNKTH